MSWTMRSFRIHCLHPRIHLKRVVSSLFFSTIIKKHDKFNSIMNVHTCIEYSNESVLFVPSLNLPATSQVFCLSYFSWVCVCILCSIRSIWFRFYHYLSLSPFRTLGVLFVLLFIHTCYHLFFFIQISFEN